MLFQSQGSMRGLPESLETTLKNWRNPASPRDNTCQSSGLMFSCNKVLMGGPWYVIPSLNPPKKKQQRRTELQRYGPEMFPANSWSQRFGPPSFKESKGTWWTRPTVKKLAKWEKSRWWDITPLIFTFLRWWNSIYYGTLYLDLVNTKEPY